MLASRVSILLSPRSPPPQQATGAQDVAADQSLIKEKAVITLPDARLTVDRQVITKLGKDQFDHSRVPQLAHLNNPSWHGGSQNGGAAASTCCAAKYEDPSVGASPQDLTRGLDAVELRHGDVHEDDIGLEIRCESHGIVAVFSLGDDPDVCLPLK